jgi:hypothetical protein
MTPIKTKVNLILALELLSEDHQCEGFFGEDA